jgi:cytochrome c5
MFALGNLFSGIASDLAENDLQGVRDVFEKFKTEYVEISKMVPEWKKEYPMKPVEELGAHLKMGDRSKVMPALGKVGAVCHDCHVKYMPMAHQKYHWGDFSTIKAKDPLSNEEVPFTRLKQYLDSNFAGIGLNIERGQKEKARKQVQSFNARFQALKTTCWRCHSGEIKYYPDEGVQGMIDKLGQTVENPSADPKVAVELVQRIGMESCFKCHLVHVPAAIAKSREHSK